MGQLLDKNIITDVLNAALVLATGAVLIAFFVLAWWNRTQDQIRARFWASVAMALMGTLIAVRLLIASDSPGEAFFERSLPTVALASTAALAWLLWAAAGFKDTELGV
jgi:hypothetical protein